MHPDIDFFTKQAELLKAMSHPVRLCIITSLAEKGECNVSYMQHCLQSPQSTISQHLQKLRLAGLITSRRQGLEVYYSIADKRVLNLLKALNE